MRMTAPLTVAATQAARCEATGKKIFRSPEAAERRRRHLRRKFDDRQHVYRCEHCHCWHLGHRHDA